MSFALIDDDSDDEDRQSVTEDSTKEETTGPVVSSSVSSGDARNKTDEGSPKSRRTLAPQWSRTGGAPAGA